MSKFKFLSVFVFLFTISIFSQESLNSYKYVIVPAQYDFQKEENQYQVNELIKFLFEKEGFIAVMSSDNFPNDLSSDRCLAVTANINKKSSFLMTKLSFDLVDCYNKTVFSTKEGKSKEKDYKKSYNEVIRMAFEDIKAQNYSYEPSEPKVVVISPAVKATQTIEVVETPKQEVVETPKETTTNSTSKAVVASTAATTTVVATKNEIPVVEEVDPNTLYAQAIDNGYQLVDSTPKVVYIVLKTALVDVYLIKGEDGIIYKSSGRWVAEYYVDGKLVRKVLTIKLM